MTPTLSLPTLARRAAAIAALALATTTAALAQAYPARAIKLVVPYAPGGSADIAARLVTDEWGKALGGTLFIENKGGAGGNIGVDMVAKAAPDGYTIGLQTVSLAINPALTPRMPYDTLKDLAPIGLVASSQHVLVVNNSLPAKNVKELVALLKAEPGGGTPTARRARAAPSTCRPSCSRPCRERPWCTSPTAAAARP